MLMTFKIIGI